MGDFFYGWRRKAGCVTLVMALAISVLWIHSLSYDAKGWVVSNGSVHALTMHSGTVIWWRHEAHPRDVSGWEIKPVPKYYVAVADPWHFDSEHWNISTPPIAIALTLLSAYLILWNPRKSEKPALSPD